MVPSIWGFPDANGWCLAMTYWRKTQNAVSTATTPGMVYFAQAEGCGLIKIGWATVPVLRIANIQNFCPLKLVILLQVVGNGRMERKVHAQFAGARRHGEWFEPVPELLALIEEWRLAPPGAPSWPAPYKYQPPQAPPPKKPKPVLPELTDDDMRQIAKALSWE